MDMFKVINLLAVFNDGDDPLGDVATGLLLGKGKGGRESGDSAGCGCAIFLVLILLGIVLYFFFKNS